jgi:anhydro-N-acetylmuramic acid kinase
MTTLYNVIGIMSGTSLDGIDVAFCRFEHRGKKWHYHIIKASTFNYPVAWKNRLSEAGSLSALDFSFLHVEYGTYLGKIVKRFITKNKFNPDFICSHGHTIFHQPEKMLTVQIGSGAAIAAETGFTTICDFRTTDVAFGGQGAPLVPIGDELLFSDFDICLNIGGFANLSYKKKNERIAFDVCPANIILNYLAGKIGLDYDSSGRNARKGKVLKEILTPLNQLEFYKLKPPKSLGREWVENKFIPLLAGYHEHPVHDVLRTVTEHIAIQIADVISKTKAKKVLVTGGGAFNTFLLELIRNKCNAEIVLPDKEIINYKEALIFAFLSILRIRNENNCLKSVTGARKDNCGGSVYVPGN